MSFAALPMYDWPEARSETDQEWSKIRDALRAQGLEAPDHLVRRNTELPPNSDSDTGNLLPNDLDLMAAWTHPQLLLAQTCWGPMQQGLDAHVVVVGQPDYSRYDGGKGPLYSSAVLMRRGASPTSSPTSLKDILPLLTDKRLAFNSTDSMSGFLALERDLGAIGSSLDIFGEKVETGGHRASIRAVAEGKADVCAVDCRTWDLAKRFEGKAGEVEVVAWTELRRGLPYVTSRERGSGKVERMRVALEGMGARWYGGK
jgi:ABC-type phosphate/phosphonate transport system substrate-binding protein